MRVIPDEYRINVSELGSYKPNYRVDNTRDVGRLKNKLAELGKVIQEFGEECKRRNVPESLILYPERVAILQEQIQRIYPALARLESNPELYDQPVAIPNQLQSNVHSAIDELIFAYRYEIKVDSEKIRHIPLKGNVLQEVRDLSAQVDYALNEFYVKCATLGINADEVLAPVEEELNKLCSQWENRYQPLIQRIEENPRLMKKSGAYLEGISEAKECVSRFISILRQLWNEQRFGEIQFVPKLVVLEDCNLATQATNELGYGCRETELAPQEQEMLNFWNGLNAMEIDFFKRWLAEMATQEEVVEACEILPEQQPLEDSDRTVDNSVEESLDKDDAPVYRDLLLDAAKTTMGALSEAFDLLFTGSCRPTDQLITLETAMDNALQVPTQDTTSESLLDKELDASTPLVPHQCSPLEGLESSQDKDLSVDTTLPVQHSVPHQMVLPSSSNFNEEQSLLPQTSNTDSEEDLLLGVGNSDDLTSGLVLLNNIREIATRAGDNTAYKFRERTKLGTAMSYKLYNNRDVCPSGAAILRICQVYGCSPGDILSIQQVP